MQKILSKNIKRVIKIDGKKNIYVNYKNKDNNL